jgi:hypothetical protein
MTSFTSTFIDMSFNPDIRDFSALGQCDISKFVVYKDDMVPYLEYAGNSMYNTGILAHKMFVDEPQPANLSPRILLDPEPVMNPRPILNFLPWP